MATFLTLPTEIRAIIFQYALNASRNRPLNPWTGKVRREPCLDTRYTVCGRIGPNNTLYETFSRRDACVTSTPLLLLNHQLHDEVTALLRLTNTAKTIYHLDLMYVNEIELWPTWLNVPRLSTHIDEINADVRIFGHCLVPESLQHLGAEGNGDGVHWCFYALLERFIVHGPIGSYVSDDPAEKNRQRDLYGRRRFYVRSLVLNIKSGSDDRYPLAPAHLKWRDYMGHRTRGRPARNKFRLGEYTPHAEWVIQTLRNKLRVLVDINNNHCGALKGHVGEIRMLLDGELYHEFRIL
ncbi:uncharacterized protein LDX57_011956 [Aspergillus melleus]|uniref:uncharacterized protein n=1 Tax=Aspergillus melleus TaxID=138277 RepID=UPI001E8DDC21|nr:uncharacterized protein LDX57_011956 [Aspergillus melleus]KAH8434309.1 hypothetical protein LDX57_011956 [Aspergillus melleus]